MLKLFVPDSYIKEYHELNLNALLRNGIQVLIVDIDNTLIPSHSSCVSKDAIAFIQTIKDKGIQPVVISNNVKKRVDPLAKDLGVPCYSFALKPLPFTYKRMMRKYRVQPNQVAAFGDQLLTDVLGGNMVKVKTILIDPITPKDNVFGSINRYIERHVFKSLHKQNHMKKGEYYDNL